MMKRTVYLFLILMGIMMIVVAANRQAGTLKADCSPCAVRQTITLIGTGFQTNAKNSLKVVVWDSNDIVTCTEPTKIGGNFTCTVALSAYGSYNIVAYQNPRTIVGAVTVTVQ